MKPTREKPKAKPQRRLFFLGYHEAGFILDAEVSETTGLLLAWTNGDAGALDALAPHVYRELKRIAATFIKSEPKENILQATALVHEVYLRLVDLKSVNWESKAHFLALCARLMRRILVDGARRRATVRHGGNLQQIDLDQLPDVRAQNDSQLLALNDALDELNEAEPRKARIVELRYFGGLSVEETAAALKVSQETIVRDWRFTRGWLLAQLTGVDRRARAQST